MHAHTRFWIVNCTSFARGKIHSERAAMIVTKYPSVPYVFAIALDWYIAVKIVGGRAPLRGGQTISTFFLLFLFAQWEEFLRTSPS